MMINKVISNVLPYFPKPFVWQFSKKYVAGEGLDDALRISKDLNVLGIRVTIDQLGEFISDLHQAEANVHSYLNILQELDAHQVNGSLSIKPTSFGLLLDEEACYRNVRQIVLSAKEKNNFVRIDMEDSACTAREIALYKRLYLEFPSTVGIVIQAYLKRSMSDLQDLASLHDSKHPINVRLCKGIYVEPEKVAIQAFSQVRKNYLDLLSFMLKKQFFVGIATHDRYLVEKSMELLASYQTPPHLFEFQMLLGVTPNLRNEIIDKGYSLKVYVPYGQDWFGYCTRRLKENPKMTKEIIKALFIKG